MAIKTLFFDLDHTLWDFEANSEKALAQLFEEFNLIKHVRSFRTFHTEYKKVNAEAWHQYSKGIITKDILRTKRFKDTFQKFGFKNDELVQKMAKGYLKISPYQTQLFPNAKETLEKLKSDGYALHIITNGFKEVQFIKLEQSGILDYFDVVLCSEEVGKNKPARIVFDRALSLANAKAEESVMIGDSYQADIVGAENAGIQAIFFDPSFEHQDKKHKWIIRDLKKIPETLVWM
ncbi:MAG: YjjG family noncanonical pyrimidine nucleotidase [Crocinitomicaceae bacterium]|nr:YjjG family noncanonical pyrimidine nucleotidase [Crocinitomicaceae bacterium]